MRRGGHLLSSQIDIDADAARWASRGGGARRRFLLLTLAALLLAGLALGRLADAMGWHRDGGLLDAKLALLRQAGPAEIYFVGTSHVLRDVDPALVDAALADAGCQGRSVNLASGGAKIQDIALVIDAIAGQQPPGRIVVTEGDGFRIEELDDGPPGSQVGSTASLRPGYLPLVIAALEIRGQPRLEAAAFLAAALRHALGWHRLYEALGAPGRVYVETAPPLLFTQRGFLASEQDEPQFRNYRRARFLERLPQLATPEALASAYADLRTPAPEKAETALALVRRIEAGGNRPVLLLLPQFDGMAAIAARNALRLRPELPAVDLALDQEALPFPDPAFFFDTNHATLKGARILSRQVGLGLCLLMKSGGL